MKVIYISGIDGCGKTTQAKLLATFLQGEGLQVEYRWFRWEPSLRKLIRLFRSKKNKSVSPGQHDNATSENREHGDWLRYKRKILSNRLFKTLWLTYASADYLAAYKRKFKNITANVVVIDRYIDDFIIDQAVNLDIPPDQASMLQNNFFLKKFHFPDLTIIIDLPAEEGYTRKSDGTPLSYLETREKYYQSMQGKNTIHLDGLKSIDELGGLINGWVKKKLEEISV